MFDRNGVTFVSVTQPFNTTTSMGRLTLNILLSFAQFEREVIGERIRDKVAASRKRGIWMGGYVPLGYDVQDRKLVVNEVEAASVRRIFQRFIDLGSATALARELRHEGFRNKQGTLIDKGYLYRLLNNRVYRGEALHKGKAYPGEHDAIIDADLWDCVHAILQESPRKRGSTFHHDIGAVGERLDDLMWVAGMQHHGRRITAAHIGFRWNLSFAHHHPQRLMLGEAAIG